mgnify:CR=1 FL=1
MYNSRQQEQSVLVRAERSHRGFKAWRVYKVYTVYLGELMCRFIWMDREMYKGKETEASSGR